MKNFLYNLLVFLIPPLFFYVGFMVFILPSLFNYAYGPDTKEQIETSFDNAIERNYDVLIMGNSRIYRGINPDKFDRPTYNFGHDDDSYNQIYYKLQYLINGGKQFEYLILGVDYFQFSYINDSRNYIYAELLPEEFLKDYQYQSLFPYKIKRLINQLDAKLLNRISFSQKNFYLKENGQYIKPGFAKKDEFLDRNTEILSVQKDYFFKILNFCHDKNIKVILLMPPVRKTQMANYSRKQKRNFRKLVNSYSDLYIQFLNHSEDPKYTFEDFTDVTHLKPASADRFSKNLNDTLNGLMNEQK